MASSAMEFQLGVFRFLPSTPTETNTHKMRPPSSCAVQHFTRFYQPLSSRSGRSTYAPDESRLIWSCEYPQLEPHAGIKMVQVLGSPVYICGLGRYKIWKRCWLHSYKVLSQRSKSKSVKQSGSKTMLSQGAPVWVCATIYLFCPRDPPFEA